MVAILCHDDLREPFRQAQGPEPAEGQAGRGDAAFLELLRQRGDDWHGVELGAMHILSPDESKAHEARRLVVELPKALSLPKGSLTSSPMPFGRLRISDSATPAARPLPPPVR